jgi:hypothetical protein
LILFWKGSSSYSIIKWGSNDDLVKIRPENDKSSDSKFNDLIPIRSNEQTIVCCQCIGSKYLVLGQKTGLISVYKLKKDKKSGKFVNDSFNCYLYGHREDITDIYVCLAWSTMATFSYDGLLIIWDINTLSYVNSLNMKTMSVYKVSISETTNDIAFICNTQNRLYFYTGNFEFIAKKDGSECKIKEQNENIKSQAQEEEEMDDSTNQNHSNINMKSLCFSNVTEGSNVNVIAVGLSTGRIRFYSTWDLTLLREFDIVYDSKTTIGCIISLSFSRDARRLYFSDTYARVYILEAVNNQLQNHIERAQQILQTSASGYQLSPYNSTKTNNSSNGIQTNLKCFT